MSNHNPYSAPTVTKSIEPAIKMAPADKKKLEIIIKDAGQFWLAIILCIFCSAIAAILIPIWYAVRLSQHSKLAKKYPALNNPSAPPKSVPKKFQAARTKLIIGMVCGGVILLMLAAYVALLLVLV